MSACVRNSLGGLSLKHRLIFFNARASFSCVFVCELPLSYFFRRCCTLQDAPHNVASLVIIHHCAQHCISLRHTRAHPVDRKIFIPLSTITTMTTTTISSISSSSSHSQGGADRKLGNWHLKTAAKTPLLPLKLALPMAGGVVCQRLGLFSLLLSLRSGIFLSQKSSSLQSLTATQ